MIRIKMPARRATQGIRHVIALVDDLLQKFVKLLSVDIGNRVDLAGPELNPQARQTGVETVVSISLDPTDSLTERKDGFMLPGNGVEKRHDLLKDSGALDNRVRHCAHLRWKLADFVTLNAFRRGGYRFSEKIMLQQ
jgi:hypothetical protein